MPGKKTQITGGSGVFPSAACGGEECVALFTAACPHRGLALTGFSFVSPQPRAPALAVLIRAGSALPLGPAPLRSSPPAPVGRANLAVSSRP